MQESLLVDDPDVTSSFSIIGLQLQFVNET